jgi:predicted PurR-regulated permease PerM
MQLNMNHIKNIALLLAAIALIVAFLFILQSVLIPLIIAGLLAFLLYPAYNKLTKWRFPKWLAAILCILAALLVSFSIAAIMIWQVSGFADDTELIKANLTKASDSLINWVGHTTHYSKSEQIKMLKEKWNESISSFTGYAFSAINAMAGFLINCTLVAIYTFLLLIYKQKFNHMLELIVKDKTKLESVKSIITDVSKVSKQFLKGTLLDVLIISILCSVGFLIIGLKQAIFLGILVAVLNVVPYIGAIVGGLIPMMVGLVYTTDWRIALAAGAVCMVVQFIDNNIIMPKVVGSSVSVNPLFSTIALLLGFMLWGIPGMVLSIPLMGIFKVVCDHVEDLKPYGYLFGQKD